VDFDWDEGNRDKNVRHGVHDWEIEEAFEDPRRIVQGSQIVDGERRRVVLARAVSSGKYLRIIYTMRVEGRSTRIRPISAIEMPGSARRRYSRGR
jgi:uncharacterized DUF497 family protein